MKIYKSKLSSTLKTRRQCLKCTDLCLVLPMLPEQQVFPYKYNSKVSHLMEDQEKNGSLENSSH